MEIVIVESVWYAIPLLFLPPWTVLPSRRRISSSRICPSTCHCCKQVSPDYIPAFYRGGHIIPRRERPRRSTEAQSRDPYTLVVALDARDAAAGALRGCPLAAGWPAGRLSGWSVDNGCGGQWCVLPCTSVC
jgi:hypothetical protein